jgi:hypothetical protein
MEGRTEMPEFLIAMTMGEDDAFPEPETRAGTLEGTIIPIRSVPII